MADTIKMAMPLRLDAIFVVGAALHTTTFVWDSTLRLVKALGAFISLRETTSTLYSIVVSFTSFPVELDQRPLASGICKRGADTI